MSARDAEEAEPDPGREALEGGPLRGPVPRGGAGAGSRRGARAPEKKRGGIVLLLLANAIPIGVTVWILTMPAAKRQAMLDKIPAGVGARAGAAGLALVLMFVLARVVLPAAKGALGALARAQAWFKTRGKVARVLLYPAELLVGLAWFVTQMLFAVDAILILACGVAFILYAIRIVKPELFPFLPG